MNYSREIFGLVENAIGEVITSNARMMRRWPVVYISKKYHRAILGLNWNLNSADYDPSNHKPLDDMINELPIYAILESIFGVGNNKDYCLQNLQLQVDVCYYIDDLVHAKMFEALACQKSKHEGVTSLNVQNYKNLEE